jgi:hypothetical protein
MWRGGPKPLDAANSINVKASCVSRPPAFTVMIVSRNHTAFPRPVRDNNHEGQSRPPPDAVAHTTERDAKPSRHCHCGSAGAMCCVYDIVTYLTGPGLPGVPYPVRAEDAGDLGVPQERCVPAALSRPPPRHPTLQPNQCHRPGAGRGYSTHRPHMDEGA